MWRGTVSRARVISFINYKGGVGKTTTTYHIGCSLAQHHNKKVLLVDIDPQTNLTFLCAPIEKWEEFKRKSGTIATLYQRFLDRKPLETRRFIWQMPVGAGRERIANLDLIPCDIDLLGEDLGGGQISGTFPQIEALRRQAREFLRDRLFLRNCIREVEHSYDYVLIDCPPNLYLMTQNALLASQWYVITAIPDHLSTIGLNILQRKVDKIGELVGSAVVFAGDQQDLAVARLGALVFVKVRIGGNVITSTHSQQMAKIRASLPRTCPVLGYTTELIGYSEAAENCLPVWMHGSINARRAAEKREYEKITEEFLRRFETLVKVKQAAS
jgi:chromosome partitioning protein